MNAASTEPQPLPFTPETIVSLAVRYPAALVRIWNADAVAAFHAEGMSTDRPMLHREHVFDLECGVRLGISRESSRVYPYPGGDAVHVSASIQPGTPIEAELVPMPLRQRVPEFLDRVALLLASITGRDDWSFIGATRGAFHYHAPVQNQ